AWGTEAAPLAKMALRRKHGAHPSAAADVAGATRDLLDQFDLFEIQFHRRTAAEDGDADLDLVLVEVELFHHAVEAGERTVEHLDLIADFVIDVDFALRSGLRFFDTAEVTRSFTLADGLRLAARTEEARDLRGVLHEVIDVVGQVELGKNVARHELAFDLNLLAALHLGDRFGRNFYRFHTVGQAETFGLRDDRIADFVLKAGIGVNDVPAGCHCLFPEACLLKPRLANAPVS